MTIKIVSVRMPEQLFVQIKEMADAKGIKVNEEILFRLWKSEGDKSPMPRFTPARKTLA